MDLVRCSLHYETELPRVVHVVVTKNFAGVERYVLDTARETASREWQVTVVGTDAEQLRSALGSAVRWLPGRTPIEAWLSLRRLGRQDVCHVHMTVAEAVGIGGRPFHHAPVISTRHFAAHRGASTAGRLLAPLFAPNLERQIAISEYVAAHLEQPPDAVISNGVAGSTLLWRPENRVILVLQRLEREKDTATALRAWQSSELWNEGWSLRVAGDGAERAQLAAWVAAERLPGVSFAGWIRNPAEEFSRAGILIAPGHSEPFGLGVVEAMAAGVPVVACAGGGHLETVGLIRETPMFAPGDWRGAGEALRSLVPDELRKAASVASRRLVEQTFTISRHVDRLLQQYETLGVRA